MKQKITAVLLMICLLVGLLSGCKMSDNIPETSSPTDTSPTTSQVPTEATQPSEEATQPTTEATQPATEATGSPTEPATEATQPAEVFTLTHTVIRLTEPGQTARLYQGSLDVSQITWGSYCTDVATFADGVLTAVGNGYTIVYARYNNTEYTCEVHCQIVSAEDRNPVTQPPSADVNSAFFDNAVFIGDSVTKKLLLHAPGTGLLGHAQFFAAGSYGVGHAARNTMLLSYQGQNMSLPDLLAATGAGKVFLMLGMNDLNKHGIDGSIGYWGTLIQQIRAKTPNIEIYIQSMTPVFTGNEKGALNNPTIDAYNSRLQTFAGENNCYYLDIASYMKDSTGGLASQYCSDGFVHLSTTGANVWIQVLRSFAQSQIERS